MIHIDLLQATNHQYGIEKLIAALKKRSLTLLNKKFDLARLNILVKLNAIFFFGNAVMASLKRRFGSRLKSLRTGRGLTQEQLADATELSIESISNMERGIFGPRFDRFDQKC
ncbi:MAG: helix-turn-helix domain-containing protein [Porticoccaceae bacterium]